MSEIINLNKKNNKDCRDWTPMPDGTKVGDTKYCALSLACRQINMKSDWIAFVDQNTNEMAFDYFCTGMYVTEETKDVDEEIS